MKFQKGVPKMGGRQKGTPNRLTTTFREAVILAFDRIGGHQAFAQWAAENPTEFYLKLLLTGLSNPVLTMAMLFLIPSADAAQQSPRHSD
jgi:hypothetical protein